MRVAKPDNVHMHWREDGDPQGLPAVFANSLGTDLRLWDDVVERLPTGLRVIRYDKRGHGLSSCPPAPYAMDNLVDDVALLLEQLSVIDCVFVGVSIGGMIGQSLASRRPDLVRALVLSNTATKMGNPAMWQARIAAIRENGLSAMADQIMQRWFSPDFLKLPEAIAWRNMFLNTPVEGYIGCCEAITGADLTEIASSLSLPALVVGGSADQAVSIAAVTELAAHIKGAKLIIMDGVGHLPSVEAPVEFARHLAEFIEEIKSV